MALYIIWRACFEIYKDSNNPTKLSDSSSLISLGRVVAQSLVPSFKRLAPGDRALLHCLHPHNAWHVLETTFNKDSTWAGAHYKAYIHLNKSTKLRVLWQDFMNACADEWMHTVDDWKNCFSLCLSCVGAGPWTTFNTYCFHPEQKHVETAPGAVEKARTALCVTHRPSW